MVYRVLNVKFMLVQYVLLYIVEIVCILYNVQCKSDSVLST